MKKQTLMRIILASTLFVGCQGGSANDVSDNASSNTKPHDSGIVEIEDGSKRFIVDGKGITVEETTYIEDKAMLALANDYADTVAKISEAKYALPTKFSGLDDLEEHATEYEEWVNLAVTETEQLGERTKDALDKALAAKEAETTDGKELYTYSHSISDLVHNTLPGLYDDMVRRNLLENAYDTIDSYLDYIDDKEDVDYRTLLDASSKFKDPINDAKSRISQIMMDTETYVWETLSAKNEAYMNAYTSDTPYSEKAAKEAAEAKNTAHDASIEELDALFADAEEVAAQYLAFYEEYASDSTKSGMEEAYSTLTEEWTGIEERFNSIDTSNLSYEEKQHYLDLIDELTSKINNAGEAGTNDKVSATDELFALSTTVDYFISRCSDLQNEYVNDKTKLGYAETVNDIKCISEEIQSMLEAIDPSILTDEALQTYNDIIAKYEKNLANLDI